MKVGMLWFDAEKGQPLEARLARAASYYREKYGEQPNLCFMHPSTAPGSAAGSLQGLALRTDKAVLPHHFWIGVGQPSTEAG
jgi:hypothetical protein